MSNSLAAPLETYGDAEHISDYYAVDKVRAFFPELGRRALTLGEFYRVARRLDITVFGDPGVAEGFCVVFAGSTYIFLDESLPEPKKTYVAYHELGHGILGHAAETAKLKTREERTRASTWMEREADLIARLALLM